PRLQFALGYYALDPLGPDRDGPMIPDLYVFEPGPGATTILRVLRGAARFQELAHAEPITTPLQSDVCKFLAVPLENRRRSDAIMIKESPKGRSTIHALNVDSDFQNFSLHSALTAVNAATESQFVAASQVGAAQGNILAHPRIVQVLQRHTASQSTELRFFE